MKKLICVLVLVCLTALVQAAPMKVASLHPLLSDMARQIGGDKVKVYDLFPENGSLHAFEPTMNEMSLALGAKLLLAMGKNVEPYLAGLRESVSATTEFVELGKDVPDVMVPGTDKVDPHWWNSPAQMKRASRTLAERLSAADPANKSYYGKRQKKYAEEMDSLMLMGRLLLSRIPQEERVLVTGHAAMCHFCEAFKLTPMAIEGVAAESQGDAASLAKLVAELRQRRVKCLFSEYNASPRSIRVVAAQLGAACMPLVMDGIASDMKTYSEVMTYNIGVVAAGLGNSKKKPVTLEKEEDEVAQILNDIQEKARRQAEKEVREEAARRDKAPKAGCGHAGCSH